MATTPHLGVTLVEPSQSQKEVTINEAFGRIDTVLNNGANDKDLATPPGSPVAGDTYIIAASPTGAWAGKANQVAYYDQYWRFIVPQEGLILWVKDEDKIYIFNGTAWIMFSSGSGMLATTYDAANIAQQLLGTTATQTVSNKTVTGVRRAVATKTAAYTATSADDLILCDSTGGALTITLPSASSSTGQVLTVRKTSSDTNAVTVSGGVAVLATQGETVVIQSNGTVWGINERRIPGTITSYTPTWTAATTNPSLGNGTIAGRWYRTGRIMTVDIDLMMGSTTTFGSGQWLLSIPSGYTMDTTAFAAAASGVSFIGVITANDAGSSLQVANAVYENTTNFKMVSQAGVSYWTNTVPFTWAVNDRISARASFPITGWEG